MRPDLTEPPVPVARDQAVGKIGKRPHERHTEQGHQDTPARKTRHKRQKGIQPSADLAILIHQKGDIRAARPVVTTQVTRGLFALILHEPDIAIHAKTLQPFFGCHAEAALPIVDQDAFRFCFVSLRRHGTFRLRVVNPAWGHPLTLPPAPTQGNTGLSKREPSGIVAGMTNRLAMILLLIALMVVAALSQAIQGFDMQVSSKGHLVWNGFLFGVPLILAGFLAAGSRWALMAGVMYGTISLALDISTIVQDLTHPDSQRAALPILWTSGPTGLLNFLLIMIGGRGFLDIGSVIGSNGTPPGGPPPNPPSHPAA